MFCTSCGNKNEDSAYCTNCGNALVPVARTSPPISAPATSAPAMPVPVPQQSRTHPSIDSHGGPSFYGTPQKTTFIKKPAFFIPGGIVLLAVVVGVAMAAGGVLRTSPLATAFSQCNLEDTVGADIGENGWTLILDSQGEDEYSGIAFSDVQCIMDAIPVPADIQARILNTSGLDGQQSDSFDGISISWSYHASTGVSMIFGKD